jgi:histone-lysine N-methyltransferase SETMAR
LLETLKKHVPKSYMSRILLHHDNARPHVALETRKFLEARKVKTLPHPPYSPDLAPCDFWLFKHIKGQLRGRIFATKQWLL